MTTAIGQPTAAGGSGGAPSLSPRAAARWLAVLIAGVAWVYWPTLDTVVRRWSTDPQYTHGYVVPIFAAVVLWLRRDRFPATAVRTSWWGVPLVVLGVLFRLTGNLLSFEWLEAGSLVPSLAGVILLAGGPAVLRWSWPAFAFLPFVLPWPWQLDQLLTYPLRRLATVCSTYLLQTLGVPALARGNIIVVNDLEVGIVEACSGLGMLMTFFALSTAVAFLIQRRRLDKWVVFASAVPIGVLMNVVRITATVFLYQFASARLAQVVFHDLAGWVMMPLALLVMWLELCWLGRLWVPGETAPPPAVPGPTPRPTTKVHSRPEEAKSALLEVLD